MHETVTFRRDGVELVVDVREASIERTVVFLPTAGESRSVWDLITPRVSAAGWRTVAPDYRGHGDSGRAATYSLADLCQDTLGIVAEHTGTPRVFVGGSIGGVIAMLLVGEMRIEAAGVVLLDIVPAPRSEAGQRERRKIAAAIERADPAMDSLDPRVRSGSLARDVIDQRERLLTAGRSIETPTLLLHGDHSHVITTQEVIDFRRDFRLGDVAEVPRAGHLVARDQPEIVGKLLVGFLDHHFPSDDGSLARNR